MEKFEGQKSEQNFTEIEVEERFDCSYCKDAGQCMVCERGQELVKKLKEANAGKKTQKGKFYKKVSWKFRP